MAAPRRTFGTVNRLPSGRWRARYTGPDGRKHSAPATFHKRREAEAWLTCAQADMLRGKWAMPSATTTGATVADCVTAYIAQCADRLKPNTLHLYDALAARFLLTPVGLPGNRVDLSTVPLAELTTPKVRDWHDAVRAQLSQPKGNPRPHRHPARIWAEASGLPVPATGRVPAAVMAAWQAAGEPDLNVPKTNPERGRTTVAQAYRLLHAALQQAVRDGLIDRSPATLRGAATARPAERTALSPQQVAALADAITPRLRAAVLLAAYGGLRPGEVFALRRRDVDTAAATVTVERTMTRTRTGARTFGTPKTAAGRRTVSVPASVAREVNAHLLRYVPADPDALIFTTPTGTPWYDALRSKAFQPARQAIGLPGLHWHDLRHTGATLAAQAGATLAELQARIGHASPAAAMIYQHAAQARDAEIAAALDAYAATPSNVIPLRPTGTGT